MNEQQSNNKSVDKNIRKNTAGILALLFGGLGIHKFYLSDYRLGIIYFLLSWTFVPMVLGIIEGFKLLSMSDQEFYGSDHPAPQLEKKGTKKFSFKKAIIWLFAIFIFIVVLVDLSKTIDDVDTDVQETPAEINNVGISDCGELPENLIAALKPKLKLDWSKFSKFKVGNIRTVRKVKDNDYDRIYIAIELFKNDDSEPWGWPVIIMDNTGLDAEGEIGFYAPDTLAENFSTLPSIELETFADEDEAWIKARECVKNVE